MAGSPEFFRFTVHFTSAHGGRIQVFVFSTFNLAQAARHLLEISESVSWCTEVESFI